MSRITVTERGKRFLVELNKGDRHTENKKQSLNNSLENSRSKSPRSLNSAKRTINANDKSELHLTIHQNIVKELSYLEEEESFKSPKIKLPMLSENRYLKKKVDKMLDDLNKTIPKSEKVDLSSLPLLTTLQNQSHNTSKIITILDQSNSLQTSNGNIQRTIPDDKFHANEHYKLLHLESKITKLLERHTETQKKCFDTASKVLSRLDRDNKRKLEADFKPPEDLDQIKARNQDALAILMRNTNSNYRKKKRLAHYWRDKYEKNWQEYHDMKTEHFQQKLNAARSKKHNREDYYNYLVVSDKHLINDTNISQYE